MINKHIFFGVLVGMMCLNIQASGPALTEQDLIYTNDQMLNFSIEGYLTTHAPYLLPHAESISHWAGFSSISPKILLALMEHQSSIISAESSEGLSRPFGVLSDEVGFNKQLKDVTEQLAELHYEQSDHSNRPFSVVKLLSLKHSSQSGLSGSDSELSESFLRSYYRLFPHDPDPSIGGDAVPTD
jgi:LasA protease